MRQRFNRNALCSSQNYKSSKAAHQEMLREKHSTFTVPECNSSEGNEHFEPVHKTVIMVAVSIFGKKIRMTKDEYNEHCQGMKYQYV